MVNNYSQLRIFEDIAPDTLPAMLDCIGTTLHSYKKSECILLEEMQVHAIGVILQGSVHMVKDDIWGNHTIITHIRENELIGESFVYASNRTASVSFFAAEDCTILFMPFARVIGTCTNACAFHHQLIKNIIRMLADKNQMLMEKADITSRKTTREKILTYLSTQARHKGLTYFEIRLDRQELADYLGVNRSALSRELSQMKTEGLIDFEKNTFRILPRRDSATD